MGGWGRVVMAGGTEGSYNKLVWLIAYYDRVRVGTIGYDWVRLGTIVYHRVRLGTIGHDWVRLGTSEYG